MVILLQALYLIEMASVCRWRGGVPAAGASQFVVFDGNIKGDGPEVAAGSWERGSFRNFFLLQLLFSLAQNLQEYSGLPPARRILAAIPAASHIIPAILAILIGQGYELLAAGWAMTTAAVDTESGLHLEVVAFLHPIAQKFHGEFVTAHGTLEACWVDLAFWLVAGKILEVVDKELHLLLSWLQFPGEETTVLDVVSEDIHLHRPQLVHQFFAQHIGWAHVGCSFSPVAMK